MEAGGQVELIRDGNGVWAAPSGKRANYPEAGHRNSFAIEEDSFWYRHRNEVILHLLRRFPFPGDFCDIGGGNGFQARSIQGHFPEKRVALVEPGYQGCLNAVERGLQHVYNAAFQEFPFQDYEVGGVGLFDVVEHVEDDESFVRELAAHLKKGARLYVTVPAYRWLWSDTDDYSRHQRRYGRRALETLAARTGMGLVYVTHFFSFLPVPTFFMRALPYRLRGRRDDSRLMEDERKQHRTGRLTGKALAGLHGWEIGRLARGRIPFGASCMAIFEVP